MSTISQEYLLEFSLEYFIPENLHPELPGPEDHIIDFPEGKKWISTVSRMIQMVDATELSTSSRTPSTVERSPLDFSNEDAPPLVTQGAKAGAHRPTVAEQEIPVIDDAEAMEAVVEPDLEREVISMGPTIKKRRQQRDAGEGGSNAPAKVLRKDHNAARAEYNARGGKSLADLSVDTEPAIHVHETQEPPVATESVSDPDPLLYAKLQPNPKQDVTQYRSSKEARVAENQDSKKSTPSPSITGSPGSIYQPVWGMPNDCRLDTPEACQDMVDHIAPPEYFSELHLLPTDEFLSQYNIDLLEAEINMRKAAEVKNSEVTKELEDLRMQFSSLEVGNAQLSQQVYVLQAQVIGEEKILAAFEVFKKHEDERVNAQCAEMDARLDALSIDFEEELQAFANVVSAGIAKGMSEGLKYGVEHGKAGLELTAMEAYDPEADSKYVAALHDLKDPNYPLIDQLEQLKDAPLDVIMASLYLDSDTGEDAS
ncbi:hypothetical protein Tco_1015475 [Tanacetum coccineum]|uniref:Transposase (Putative), gypsy type n=1 Tax=Tanacetum coccineum TaxID=301880 RepID=A0ABQ5FKW6_9ASTR